MRPLRSMQGQALPIVIVTMAVLAVLIVAVMSGVTSQQSATAREQKSQSALDLADAGVSTALSILSNAPNPLVQAALPPGSEPTEGGGTSSYSGQLVGTTWTLTGVGTLPSPVAGAEALTQRSTLQVSVSPGNTPWQYLFADGTKGCLTLKNNAQVTTPLYTRGNLCLGNNAHVTGSPVAVNGTVKIKNSASIGLPGAPIASATLGSCVGGGPARPCSAADHVYASSLVQGTTNLVKPPIDLASWYANAAPGPSHPCTSGSVPGGFDNDTAQNSSRGAFSPTAGGSYDCQYWENGVLTGRLAWDSASHTLTVLGTILFDGSLTLSGTASYVGRGTIYSTGKITSSKNTRLCGTPACDATWDPATNLLVLVAGGSKKAAGIQFKNNTVFQGGLYAVNDFSASNNTVLWGAVIARQMKISNNARILASPIGSVPPGAPGAGGTLVIIGGTWHDH